MTDLVLFGTGGLAREVLQVALDANEAGPRWNVLGFLDDDAEMHGRTVHDLPVLGGAEWALEHPGTAVVVAIGGTSARRRIVRRLAGARFATLVHPRSWLGRRVQVGEGSIVCAGTAITTDIVLGQHVILNLNCTVGHDSWLGDFVTAAPTVNISGNVIVGEGCDLGTGSTIIQGVEIGEWSVLGAGATVVRSLPKNVTAVGSPAKPIKERPAGWQL